MIKYISSQSAAFTKQSTKWLSHDDVIQWKNFPRYCLFVRWIHRSPVNSPHKGQWFCGSLMFYLICVWINSWVNNREAGDLRRHRAHYDVTVMGGSRISLWQGYATCRRRSGLTLAQVMAWCLTAPSHYLNRCWLNISEVHWQWPEGNFASWEMSQQSITKISMKSTNSKFHPNLPGANELTD